MGKKLYSASKSALKLYIIGFGPGSDAMLTDKAKDVIKASCRVFNTREMPLKSLFAELDKNQDSIIAVLVSGDCGFYSVTKTIIKDFSGRYDIEVIPGIGSIPYFSAKIKIPYDDAVMISLHGREGNIAAQVAYNKKVFTLTGGTNTVSEICHTLCCCGLGDIAVCVGERLSYPEERIIHSKANELKNAVFDDLSVIYIENPMAVTPSIPLCDSDFIRGDIPMTKEEVRWLSLQKLTIVPSDTVFDIGAGTGSVSVEMARRATNGKVYAIEVKEDACALVKENIAKHGAYNTHVVCGMAPDVLDGLAIPSKAFIGGSCGNMDSILEKLVSLNPKIKITANAITLQTLGEITSGFKKHGIGNADIICVNIAKAKKVGGYDMMMAQNPVYIVTGTAGHKDE